MKAGRIVVLVIGCIVGVLGLGLLIVGIVGTVAYGVARDDDGFFRTDEFQLTTATAAITSDRLDLSGSPGDAEWLTERGDLATVSLEIEPSGDQEIFAGIGPSAEVARYLDSIPHERVDDYDEATSTVIYEPQDGTASPAPPGEQTFWVADLTTTQPGVLTWDVESGDWTVVLMNADGSGGIDADARVGIKIDWLLPVAIVLIVVGVVLLAGGTVAAALAARGPRRPPEQAAPGPLPPPAAPPASTTSSVAEDEQRAMDPLR